MGNRSARLRGLNCCISNLARRYRNGRMLANRVACARDRTADDDFIIHRIFLHNCRQLYRFSTNDTVLIADVDGLTPTLLRLEATGAGE